MRLRPVTPSRYVLLFALFIWIGLQNRVVAQCSTSQEVGVNLIENGDFEDPTATFVTDYPTQEEHTGVDCLMGSDCNPPNHMESDCGCFRNWSMPGEYWVGDDVSKFHFQFGGITTRGDYSMFVDAECSAGAKVWCQDVDIEPNTTYYFTASIASIKQAGDVLNPGQVSSLNFTVGNNQLADALQSTVNVGEWVTTETTWFSGAVSGTMQICIENTAIDECGDGNDFALDDISFVGGCSFSDPGPIPDLGDDINICGLALPITLDPQVVSGTATYMWSTGETTSTIDVSTPGTYSVCVQEPGSCERSDIINITGDYDIELGPNIELCGPISQVLDPGYTGPGVSYQWALDGASIGGNTSTLTATAIGTYSVTVTDPGCGQRIDQMTISAGDFSIELGPDQDLCDPISAVLDPGYAVAGTTYQWALDGAVVGGNTSTFTAAEPGTYRVTVTDPVCGPRVDQITITTSLPTIDDIEYCSQSTNSVTIAPTGFTTYNFYNNEGDANPFATGATTAFDVSGGGDYTVWIEDGDASQASGVGPSLTGSNQVGTDQSDRRMKIEVSRDMTLNSLDFIAHFWSNGTQSGTIRLYDQTNGGAPVHESSTINITHSAGGQAQIATTATLDWDISPGTYYLALNGSLQARFLDNGGSGQGFPFAYDDGNGEIFTLLDTKTGQAWGYDAIYFFHNFTVSLGTPCARVPVNIVENCTCIPPVAVIAGGGTVCEGETAPDITITITPGDAGTADSWDVVYAIDGVDQNVTNTTNTTITISDPIAGEYTITSVIENDGGNICAGVDLSGNPEVAFDPLPNPVLADEAICEGESTTLDPGAFDDYLWGDASTDPSLSVSTGGQYHVTVTDANGCVERDTMTLTVNPLPNPVLADEAICEGESATLDPGIFDDYLWNDASTDPSLSASADGQYHVTVTDANGCAERDTMTLTVNPLPNPVLADEAICEGESATLDPGVFDDYLWNDASTDPSLSASASGQYHVTVTDANGCVERDTMTLTVNPLPNPVLADEAICEGESTTLDPAVFTTYLWNDGSTDPSLSVSASGQYHVTVTDTNGCVERDTMDLTVNPLPNPVLADETICAPLTTTLNAGAFDTYLWSDGSTSASLSVSDEGDYHVTVTDANGCAERDTMTLTVNPPGDPELADAAICEGETTTLDPGVFDNYLWSDGSTDASLSVSANGQYHVTVSDDFGCWKRDTMTLTVNPLPDPELANEAICEGDNTTLDPGTYDTYLWSDASTGPSLSASASGQYHVTVTDGDGCIGRDTMTLTLNPLPNPVLADETICAPLTTTLNAGAFDTYLWSDGSTSASITVGDEGQYHVTVTDANGCAERDTMTLTVNPPGDPELADVAICEGETTTLDPGVFDNYLWSDASTDVSLSVSASGQYHVTVSDDFGCWKRDTMTLTVNPLPNPVLNDEAICEGENVTLDPGTFDAYLWGDASTGASLSASAQDDYHVTVTDANGCVERDTMTLIVNPLPNPLLEDATICPGANLTLDPGVFDAYLWSDGSTSASLSVSSQADFHVTVTDANGCVERDTMTLTVGNDITLNLQDITLCTDDDQVLDIGVYDNYLWSTGATTQTITVGSGTYHVTVEDALGCSGRDTAVVELFPIPDLDIPDDEICQGETVTLDATGFDAFLWNDGSTDATYITGNDGNHAVTVTDVNGCTARDTMMLTVHALPEPQLRDTTICAPESVTLNPGVFDAYLWSTASTDASVSLSASGQYQVTVTDVNGCSASESMTLTVNPPGNPVLQDTAICTHQSVTIHPGFFENYLWSDGSTGAGITINQGGDYHVTVSDDFGCWKRDTMTLTIFDDPIPALNDASICSDGEALLSPGTFESYLWGDGSSGPSLSASAGGQYHVTVTDANGCFGVDTMELSIYPEVNPTLNDTAVCDGDIAQLNPGTFASYLWADGSTGPSLSAGVEGQYAVTVTAVTGCTGTDAMTLGVNPLPQPSLRDTAFCLGGIVGLNAGDYASFQWNTGDVDQIISAENSGNYNVTVTDVYGCENTAGMTLTVHDLPIPELTDTAFCNGPTVTLDPGDFESYLWNDGSTTASLSASTQNNYEVTVTDANGCVGDGQATITVYENPTPELIDYTICLGSAVSISPGEFDAYVWSTSAETDSITIDQAGDYSVTVTTDDGCMGQSQMTLTVATELTPVLRDTSICEGDSLVLDPGGFNTYNWSTGATARTITISDAGNYGVTVSSGMGCVASNAATIAINALPAPEVSDYTICPGSARTVGLDGFNSYLWSNGTTASSTAYDVSGDHWVEVTNAQGCAAVDTFTIAYFETAVPTLSDTTICQGDTAILRLGDFASYSWTNGSTADSTIVTVSDVVSVSVTDQNGCVAGASAQVSVRDNPMPDLQSAAICADDSTALDPGVFDQYIWSNGQTTATIYVNQEATYAVTVLDDLGCTGQTSADVMVRPLPDVLATMPPQICLGESFDFAATFSGTPDFELQVNINGVATTIQSTETSYNQTITPVGLTSIELISIADNFCSTPLDDTLTTSVKVPPTFGFSGDTSLCLGDSAILYLDITGSAPFTVAYSDGTNTTVLDGLTHDNQWKVAPTATTEYTLLYVEDANAPSCQTPAGPNATVEVGIIPAVTVSGDPVLCPGDSAYVQVNIEGNGPFVFSYSVNGVETTVNTAENNFTLGLLPTTDLVISPVSIASQSLGCEGPTYGTSTIQLHAAPDALWSGTYEICEGDELDIPIANSGTGPFDITYQVGGVNQFATDLALNDAVSLDDPTAATYTLTHILDQATGCTTDLNQDIEVVLNESPITVNLDRTCAGDNTTYTVEFDIQGGDADTYTVGGTGGTLTGSHFVSDPIPNGTTYTFIVSDVNDCYPDTVTGVKECFCTSYAGTVARDSSLLCAGEHAVATHFADEVLDSNDVFKFVLHTGTGPAVKNALAWNDTPVFDYDATYPDQWLYISAVVGSDDGTGSPDLTEHCLSVSPGRPIKWTPIPTVSLTGTDHLCLGESSSFQLTTTGVGPFEVTIANNGVNQVLTNVTNNYPI